MDTTELQNCQFQLAQVEQQLEKDPENEEMLKLREDLLQLIALAEEMTALDGSRQPSSRPTTRRPSDEPVSTPTAKEPSEDKKVESETAVAVVEPSEDAVAELR
jgi:survival-of-motor-neuron-related-splicing factor 30